MRHETSGARRMLRIAVATAALLAAGGALAQETPVGRWRTIDDHTGKPSGLVRIDEAAGVFSGVIEQILDPDKPKDSVCDKCTDERKGQPIVGLTILRNLKRSGERYEDGDILDPKNGKVYHHAGSPFIKNRETVKMTKEEAEAKGLKPSKSYLKAKAKSAEQEVQGAQEKK